MQTPSSKLPGTHPPGTPWIVIAAGGTLETALLPYHLIHLKSFFEIDVSVAVSPAALNFVTETALKAITGMPVYHEELRFDPITGKPLHLRYSEANLLVIYPASARILVQCALGEITCPVTRLFSFSPKERILISPALHPRMDPQIYHRHLKKLRNLGCTVLGTSTGINSSHSPWPQVEHEIAERLFLELLVSPKEVLETSLEDPKKHRE